MLDGNFTPPDLNGLDKLNSGATHTVECDGHHAPTERCTTAEDDFKKLCPDCKEQAYRDAVLANPEATVDYPHMEDAARDAAHLETLWSENDARLNPDEPAPDVDLDPDRPLCPACEGKRPDADMICELYARTWDLRDAGQELEDKVKTEAETITELLNRVATLEARLG
jgi:hypothetical protein